MALLKRANPGISINRQHPAADQLQFLAMTENGGQMVDLVRKLKGTSAGSASTSQDAIIGRATNLNTGTTTDVEFAGYKTAAQSYVTAAALVKVTALPSAVCWLLSDNVPATSGMGLGLSSANKFRIVGNSAVPALAANAVVAGGIYFVAGSMHINAANNPGVLVYRRLDATGFEAVSTTTTPTAMTPSGTITLGKKSSTAFWPGDIAWALLSYSYTSIEELVRWSRDPWSIFFRGRDWASYSSASSAATAALSAAMAMRTQALAGPSVKASIAALSSPRLHLLDGMSQSVALKGASIAETTGRAGAAYSSGLKAIGTIQSKEKAGASVVTGLLAQASAQAKAKASPSLAVGLKGATSAIVHAGAGFSGAVAIAGKISTQAKAQAGAAFGIALGGVIRAGSALRATPFLSTSLAAVSSSFVHLRASSLGAIALVARSSVQVRAAAHPVFSIALNAATSVRTSAAAATATRVAIAAATFLKATANALIHVTGGFTIIQKPRMSGVDAQANLSGTKTNANLSGTKPPVDLDGEIDQ